MSESNQESGVLNFSVDSSLLFQLGEQLVATPSIALAELVKNAYDADATRVIVTVENIDQPGGTMLIEDDGHGMTLQELISGWMRIATGQKRTRASSKRFHRAVTGAKGIGRFASRRLGNRLLLQSTAAKDEGGKEIVTATFDWPKFESGIDLVTIPITYTREDVSEDANTGVTLLIEELRDAWTEEDVSNLKRDLLSLQSPFPDLVTHTLPQNADIKQGQLEVDDPGFDFVLLIEGSDALEGQSGGLGDDFLSSAWSRIEGFIDEHGRANYRFEGLRNGDMDQLIDERNEYFGLEGARFRIYHMIYAAKYFSDTGIRVRDAQRKGREDGGVRLYLDNFRVFPYGDPGDDWLQLDAYAARNIDMAAAINPSTKVLGLADSISGRPFLLIPKNYQVFGVVAISQQNQSQIGINVSRERLIETPTVVSLRRFVQNGIYWLTLKYAAELANEKAARAKPQTTPTDILLETKRAIVAQSEIPENQRFLILRNLDEAIGQIQTDYEDQISEISMLRTLASAGTTLALMNHQMQALTGSILQTRADLDLLRPEIPSHILGDYDDIASGIAEWHTFLKLQVSQLGLMLAPDSRQRRQRLLIRDVVEDVRKPMSYYMKQYGVTFLNDVPQGLRTPPIYLAELYSVLINLLSNALKFVHGQPDRRVAVMAEQRADGVTIRMLDSGTGVPAERRESSFKPFVTTSMPNPILGVGTGLGLKVVRDIMETYGGTAVFIDPPPTWSTCIELTLIERDGSDGREISV